MLEEQEVRGGLLNKEAPTVTLRSPKVLSRLTALLQEAAGDWVAAEGNYASILKKESHNRNANMDMLSQ